MVMSSLFHERCTDPPSHGLEGPFRDGNVARKHLAHTIKHGYIVVAHAWADLAWWLMLGLTWRRWPDGSGCLSQLSSSGSALRIFLYTLVSTACYCFVSAVSHAPGSSDQTCCQPSQPVLECFCSGWGIYAFESMAICRFLFGGYIIPQPDIPGWWIWVSSQTSICHASD